MEKEGVKSKLNLPGGDIRVKQWVVRLCPSRAHTCSSKREEEVGPFLENETPKVN